MNHEDENELFARLEADLSADPSGDVVDMSKARTARSGAEGSGSSASEDRPTESADPDGDAPVMVDGPQPKDPGLIDQARDAKRRPILPQWARSRAELVTAARWLVGYLWHIVAFHAVRVPVYIGRLIARTPRGAVVAIVGWGRWASDAEGAPLRDAEARRERTEEYLKLARQRDRRVRWRGMMTAVLVVVVLAVLGYLVFFAAVTLQLLALAVAVVAFGIIGAPADAPLSGHAVVKSEAPKLTAGIVLQALGSIGNDKINAALKRGDGIRFTSEIHRDGPGYRADIELPHGVTAEDVMEKRHALASGLRRKLGCVWPAPNPDDHEGTLILWVGDKPMNELSRPQWPLAKAGQVDLFKAVPFGNDQRMRWVSVTLMFVSVVIGSIPRMGKTFLMRLLLLIAALDPRAELHMYDFKGTGDFRPLEKVAHRYRSGEEDEDVEYCLDGMRALKKELRRRAKVIKSLPLNVCPESKVTSALASDKRYGLHPIVVAMDECQVPFEHPEYKDEIEEICTDIVKRGPALGIIGIFGTQRPDKASLPKGISANAVLRFALKVTGQTENDMILGTSMYKAGYRATMFSFKRDKGIAWFVGEDDDPKIVCGAFVDAPAAEAIAARARKLREDYGNVTGYAVGENPEADITRGHDLLADVLAVVPAEEEKVWCERIAARLAKLRPEVYGGWKAETVTTSLKPHGISAQNVWSTADDGKGTTRRGVVRAHIAKAVTQRGGNQRAA